MGMVTRLAAAAVPISQFVIYLFIFMYFHLYIGELIQSLYFDIHQYLNYQEANVLKLGASWACYLSIFVVFNSSGIRTHDHTYNQSNK